MGKLKCDIHFTCKKDEKGNMLYLHYCDIDEGVFNYLSYTKEFDKDGKMKLYRPNLYAKFRNTVIYLLVNHGLIEEEELKDSTVESMLYPLDEIKSMFAYLNHRYNQTISFDQIVEDLKDCEDLHYYDINTFSFILTDKNLPNLNTTFKLLELEHNKELKKGQDFFIYFINRLALQNLEYENKLDFNQISEKHDELQNELKKQGANYEH